MVGGGGEAVPISVIASNSPPTACADYGLNSQPLHTYPEDNFSIYRNGGKYQDLTRFIPISRSFTLNSSRENLRSGVLIIYLSVCRLYTYP